MPIKTNYESCQKCRFYHNIQKTLGQLNRRVKSIKPPPGEIPKIEAIDIAGETLTVAENVGGDHIIYLDFNRRYDLDARIKIVELEWQEDIKEFSKEEIVNNPYFRKKKKQKDEIVTHLIENKNRAGVLVADVKGHDESSSFIVGMLHQSFLTGALYEMNLYGEITSNLFEKINTRFYNSSSLDDFLTMIYGEINADGTFEFISAGHPPPKVFSNKHDCLLDIPENMIVNYPPIGVIPSRKDIDINTPLNQSVLGYKKEYTVNKLELMGDGDILLLYTDGLQEMEDAKEEPFFPNHLEQVVRSHKHLGARQIADALKEEIHRFNKVLTDDVTYVIIKKNGP